jgi:DeoR family glycerol-3-phosphate regulon repressor
MTVETRQARILDMLRRRGYASIDELVAEFEVTPQTIRRDLQDLFAQGLLRRHHGGASIPASTVNTDYAHRHVEQAAEKEQMATAVISLIPSGASLFMTPGTTIEAVATALAQSDLTNLFVVTSSTVTAEILGRNPNITVFVTGGRWQAANFSLGGPVAAEIADRYRCDILVTSVGAIDADGWLLEYRDEETTVAKAMFANARQRILVADHSKFSKAATWKLAHMKEMTTFITDQAPPESFQRSLKASGCRLVIASGALERRLRPTD